MLRDSFASVRMNEANPKWKIATRRESALYQRENEVRSEFTRDYNRILHCAAYRRLKHKTQVFFATRNDHICTRIEHVNHVAAVSYTIANYLGLNIELTNAIAIGHDVGHTPFGHVGGEALGTIAERELSQKFWHEKNSLRFVDKIEILPDPNDVEKNLDLTYAVRDGIVLHCGEVNDNKLIPREEIIDLESIQEASEFSPFTWEGCVVKISDKISYLGRDIEDAVALNIMTMQQLRELKLILKDITQVKLKELNNTELMHNFIVDLCSSSSPELGIQFSAKYMKLISSLKGYNEKYIYNHERLKMYKKYAELIINSIFETLKGLYRNDSPYNGIQKEKNYRPLLLSHFTEWLARYSNFRDTIQSEQIKSTRRKYGNKILYNLYKEEDYIQAVIDFMSGMTDNFALTIFNEITSF